MGFEEINLLLVSTENGQILIVGFAVITEANEGISDRIHLLELVVPVLDGGGHFVLNRLRFQDNIGAEEDSELSATHHFHRCLSVIAVGWEFCVSDNNWLLSDLLSLHFLFETCDDLLVNIVHHSFKALILLNYVSKFVVISHCGFGEVILVSLLDRCFLSKLSFLLELGLKLIHLLVVRDCLLVVHFDLVSGRVTGERHTAVQLGLFEAGVGISLLDANEIAFLNFT